MKDNPSVGIIDETAYLAYEGQGYEELSEEQKKKLEESQEEK